MTAKPVAEERECSAASTLARATELILQGEPVVIPTETVYGLTAAADNPEAVRLVFELKRRDLSKPSAIFLASASEVEKYAEAIAPLAQRVITEFLPGPLTVVLKARCPDWPGIVGADGRIGIRVSDDSFVRDLVNSCQRPLLATSAGTDGHDLHSLDEVKTRYSNKVRLIVYKEEVSAAQASTVVDLSGTHPKILRQGELNLPDWCWAEKES